MKKNGKVADKRKLHCYYMNLKVHKRHIQKALMIASFGERNIS
jgi:hypothetical protein